MKTVLKLIVVGLMLNALWRLGSAYVSFYEFKDSVRIAALGSKSDDVLRQRILELASTYRPANSDPSLGSAPVR